MSVPTGPDRAPEIERPWERIAAAAGRPFPRALWDKARATRRIVYTDDWGVPLWRFRKDVGPVARGSVLAAEGFLWDFPHIARITHLRRGIARHFDAPFEVEEKIDGYNVRVARLGGRLLAFSRNGEPCPFATDRLRELPGLVPLFDAMPDAVVCLELAGPGNPYNVLYPPRVQRDIAFFIFDVGRLGPRRFLPPVERSALLARHGLPEVRRFGRFEPTQPQAVYDVVRALDREGGEGIVMKGENGERRLKYYCLGTGARDLRATTGLLGSVDASFVIHHLVQMACTLHEWEVGGGQRERLALGGALLDALLEALAQVDRGEAGADAPAGFVEERFEVRLHERDNARRLIERMRRSATVQVRLEREERCADGMWRLVFRKRYLAASGYFRSRLSGRGFID